MQKQQQRVQLGKEVSINLSETLFFKWKFEYQIVASSWADYPKNVELCQ